MYKHFFKRLLDFFLSLMGLMVLSPVFIVVTVLLFIVNRGTPFFVQSRPGRRERIFKIIKFKTMNDKRDAGGKLLSDAERLTSVGRFIRKASLDEIPQLINVIKGDMSLVGPRPLLIEYLPLYNAEQKRRHDVRPGITGWAQVNGRNAISWEEKFRHDVWYVNRVGFSLDIKIILLTLRKIFAGEGVNSTESVTMERFYGNNI